MTRPIRVPDGVVLPQLDVLTGGAWWVVGTAAMPAGFGTLLMAAGLGATGAMWAAVRRRHGAGAPLGPGRRSRLIRLIVVVVALLVAAGVALGYAGWAELAAPTGCAIVAIGLFALSSVLEQRIYVAAGGLLLVLAAAGALMSLDTAGATGPQGLVGLGSAAVLWAVGAVRLGALDELRGRVRR